MSDLLDAEHRASLGQFFTPDVVADFLASLLKLPAQGRFTLLDPGAGVGSLSAAVAARAIRERPGLDLHLVAFEVDPVLFPHLSETLADCERTAREAGCRLTADLRTEDFVTWAAAQLGELAQSEAERFSACVMNPPYRKISVGSAERRAMERLGVRVSNIYPAFLALAAALLEPAGQLSAITPRSWANGPYFEPFRHFFLDQVALTRLHVFERRGAVFADSQVLQENVVFHAAKDASLDTITLSVSEGYRDEPTMREVERSRVVRPDDKHAFVHIPVEEHATVVAERIAELPAELADLPAAVSTGKVVDFRARAHLIHDPDPETTVPLIYPSHVRGGRVDWPRLDGRKPNALELCDKTQALMLPSGTYVLVKRFTAKEERRRVVAAVLQPQDAPGEHVAIENHLNVYHCDGAGLPLPFALGLATFLNSSTVDDFVRQFSGHTQINATDLRLLRYPTDEQLVELGELLVTEEVSGTQEDIDELVAMVLPSWASQGARALELVAVGGAA